MLGPLSHALLRARPRTDTLRQCRRGCSASVSHAADKTIALLKTHPGLMRVVLERGDDDVKSLVLSETAPATFREADVDGDGNITRDEQLTYIRRRYPATQQAHAVDASEDTSENADPTRAQLARLAVRGAVPFIAFGFLDNAIMIVAGEQIDATFGTLLSLSSMAAAGLGNLVSDVVGIQASTFIERGAAVMGLPNPQLSPAQLQRSSARTVSMLASVLGISIGCILGLSPLLFMEDEEVRGLRKTFAAIDKDSSGSIGFGELDDWVHSLGLSLPRQV